MIQERVDECCQQKKGVDKVRMRRRRRKARLGHKEKKPPGGAQGSRARMWNKVSKVRYPGSYVWNDIAPGALGHSINTSVPGRSITAVSAAHESASP